VNDPEQDPLPSGLSGAPSRVQRAITVGCMQVVKVFEPTISRSLGVHPDEPLLKVSRVRFADGRPLLINELITHKDLMVGEDLINSDKPLRQLLGLERAGETMFMDRSLEVIQATPAIAASLD